MKKFLPLLCITLLACTRISFGQTTPVWVNLFTPPMVFFTLEQVDMKVDAAGNSFVLAFVRDTPTNQYSFEPDTAKITTWLIKYDANGTLEWADTVPAIAYADSKLILDEAGNVYIMATTESDTTLGDFLTLKYNSSGVLQWSRMFNSAFNDYDTPWDIALDASHNVYVTGRIFTPVDFDIPVVKYSAAGELLWASYISLPADYGGGQALATDAGENVYLLAYSADPNGNLLLVKYDAAGNEIWSERSALGACYFLKLFNDQYLYTAGSTTVMGAPDFFAMKYDADGNFSWSGTSSTGIFAAMESVSAMAVDDNGNQILAGRTSASDDWDFFLTSFDVNGNVNWVNEYDQGDSSWDNTRAVEVDPNGNVYVLGEKGPYNSSYNFTTLIYDNSGSLINSFPYSSAAQNRYAAHSISLDADNNVYESGIQEDATGKHIITLKYDQAVGIPSANGDKSSFKIFPNPFASSVTVSVHQPDHTLNSCRVLNLFGQPLHLETFNETVSLNLSMLPPGIYYCEVNTEKGRMIRKMVKQ